MCRPFSVDWPHSGRLFSALEAEGLLGRNRQLPLPAVPLRVGLVASAGTEGYRDFLRQLVESGWAFHVFHVAATVQGTERAVVAGGVFDHPLASGRLDLVVAVRGGGSKADLAAFDSEVVARAVAAMPVPVWTGIGHTGDQSVADIVANRSFSTPTECGQEVVSLVASWWGSVSDSARVIARRAGQSIGEAERHGGVARGRLTAAARHQLRRHREHLRGCSRRLVVEAPRFVEAQEVLNRRRAARLGSLSLSQVDRVSDRLVGWRRLLDAYDVDRQLERGYSLTYDEGGRVVRTAKSLGRGSVVVTRFGEGTATSVVKDVEEGRR